MVYKTGLRAPVNVTWEITSLCNLSCAHCLSSDIRNAGASEELSFEQCSRFIDELDRLKVFQINFGGGEPFLRKDFLHILEYAHSKRITTCVSTNGTVLDDKLVRRIKVMDLLYIQVSLDGATPDTNDQIRGSGTFEHILKGIKLLAKYEIPHFSINTVVTRTNFMEIDQLYELARKFGAKTRLSRFRPSGRGKAAWEAYHLNKDQLLALSSYLSSHRDVLTGDSFFSVTTEDRRDLGLNMCGAAKMTCSVSPNGNVYPCAFLQDSSFLAGNITESSFEGIWQESPALRMIRAIKIDSCASCIRFGLCRGGCPAVAYFLTQSLKHSDPECMSNLQKDVCKQETSKGAVHNVGTI